MGYYSETPAHLKRGNMKRQKLHLILPLILTIFALFSHGCAKEQEETTDNSVVFDGNTYWECNVMEVNPDTLRILYLFNLTQSGNTLNGKIIVRDSATMQEGIITGVIDQGSIFLRADFDQADLSFSFWGVPEYNSNQVILTGTVQTILPMGGGDQVHPIDIVPDQDDQFTDILPDNPYVFRRVNISDHPNDSSVIFIHGMTGDLTHWDEMVSMLTPEFKKRHDVYLFQYNWKDSIAINGRILYDSIMKAGLTNPIIVAHSMGGLVARTYVAKGGELAMLVALGTPHLGTPLAKLANLFVFSGFPGPRDMATESPFINSLLANQQDAMHRNKYMVFGGQMKGSFQWVNKRIKWVWAESYYNLVDKIGFDAFVLFHNPPNDGLVPLSSALFEGYSIQGRYPVLEWVDHRNLRTPTIATDVLNFINNM